MIINRNIVAGGALLAAAWLTQPASAQSMAEVTARMNRIASGEYAASVEAERSRTPQVRLTPAQTTSAARRAVLDELRDPASAQFRNVRRFALPNGTTVFCGEVNGRNGYGGYAGFVRFEAGVSDRGNVSAQLDSQEPRVGAYFQASWDQMCGRIAGVATSF